MSVLVYDSGHARMTRELHMKKKNPILEYFLNNHVLVALAVVAAIWLLFQIRDVLVLIFISYIIMAALTPFVTFLVNRKVSKVLAVVVVFFITIVVVVLSIFPLIPFFASQIELLFKNFPQYLDQSSRILGLKVNTEQINSTFTSQIGNISENAFALTTFVFGGFFSLITVIVISFYLLLDHTSIRHGFINIFPKSSQNDVGNTLTQIEEKLGAWFRGQLVLSFSIGFLTYLAYAVLALDFALPLALFAGIMEAVPTIGPFLGAVPAIIVALTISSTKTFLVIVVYVIIQTVEANFLVPKIMQRAVGLSPIIVITGIMIGAKLMGLWGALLSIPFIAMLIIIFNSIRESYE